MLKIVDETCPTCGAGMLSTGVYAGREGARVRWAMWSCGHMWNSADADATDESRLATTMQRVLAATGIRRHAPI